MAEHRVEVRTVVRNGVRVKQERYRDEVIWHDQKGSK